MPLIDIIGWIGSALVVIAYTLNIMGKLKAEAISYVLMNLVGSVCLIANTIYHDAIPSTAVNVVWIAVAVIALFRKSKKLSS